MQAHEELSDKARRRKVDMLLDAEHAPSQYSNYRSGGTGGTSSFYRPSNFNASSFYENFASHFGASAYGRTAGAAGGTSTRSGGSTSYRAPGAGASNYDQPYGTSNAYRPFSSNKPGGGAGAAGGGAGGSSGASGAAGGGSSYQSGAAPGGYAARGSWRPGAAGTRNGAAGHGQGQQQQGARGGSGRQAGAGSSRHWYTFEDDSDADESDQYGY